MEAATTGPDSAGAESTYKPRIVKIRAGASAGSYWKDIFESGELLMFLVWRDVMVRYKQAAFGVAWAFLRPIITVAIFTFVFSVLGRFPSDGQPYPLMVFAALLPWQLFASALSESSNSLVNNTALLSKVYFPRLLVPAGSFGVAMVDFLLSWVVLAGVMVYYQVGVSVRWLMLPGLIACVLLVAASLSVWLSALNVRYRDIRFIVPFIVQFGLYLSPVGFSSTMIPERFMDLYCLNPMVFAIEGFRWVVLGGDFAPISWAGTAAGIALCGLLLWSGIHNFRRMERSLADVI